MPARPPTQERGRALLKPKSVYAGQKPTTAVSSGTAPIQAQTGPANIAPSGRA